jgi:hypothetical protein
VPAHDEVVGDRHLDAQHEAHPVEELHQPVGRTGLDVGEHLGAGLDQLQVVLDVTLGRQHQGLGGLPGLQVGDVLAQQRVQPAQAVRAADAHDRAVRQVDRSDALGEPALLEVGVAVVAGDGSVGRVSGYGLHVGYNRRWGRGFPLRPRARGHVGRSGNDLS